MMCGLRLWYTLPLLLSASALFTLLRGKKSYCAAACPMATVQDSFLQFSPRPLRQTPAAREQTGP